VELLKPFFSGAVLLLAGSSAALCAENSVAPALPERPTVTAVRIEATEAPKIDGDVSDAVWSRAQLIDQFYQMEPVPLTTPTERTEVRILYDREQLYVALYAHDSQPDRIRATTMERDAPGRSDDVLRVMLDPRQTGREGYFFEIKPAGARRDALILNGQTDVVNKWNMLWRGKSQRVADGWTAEMALPFRGLSYDPASTTWGLDIGRELRRTNETIRWSPASPGMRPFDLTYEGSLNGLAGMSQGKGLDVLAYMTGRATRNWAAGRTVSTGHPSATAYYKVTPALTGLLTLNTDFSDKPLDSRQVNTTRFSLFEPETREFFLEDADAFEFGNFGQGALSANGRPFFSRNIGLANGNQINLDAGAKLSGSIGGVRLGALSVRTGAGTASPAQTLSVARATAQVLDESRVGGIITDGDPTGLTSNRVVGTDFLYRNSNYRPGKQLNIFGYLQRSLSSTLGNDDSFGSEVRYPNEPWGFDWRYKQVGRNFKPALGFVNRQGIRSWYEEIDYAHRPRNSWLRKVQLTTSDLIITELDNRLQSRDTSLAISLLSVHDDELFVGLDYFREAVAAPYSLPGNVVVGAGRYHYFRPTLDLQTLQSRRVSVHWTFACCSYLDGRSVENDLQVSVRAGPRFNLDINHRLQTIDLPGGRTTIHIESLSATRNFTPEMKLVTELQYDNVSHQFGASLRYRWEVRPTTELLVTLGESATLYDKFPNARYHSQATAVSVRLGHRFQN
jgi:hypothetical protein